jgi:hypothetical protein
VGIPASPKACFTLPWIRMIVRIARRPAERTISPEGGRHLLSLLSSDSNTFHVTRDRHGTSASLRSRECFTRYPGHYSRAFASFRLPIQPAISMPCG